MLESLKDGKIAKLAKIVKVYMKLNDYKRRLREIEAYERE